MIPSCFNLITTNHDFVASQCLKESILLPLRPACPSPPPAFWRWGSLLVGGRFGNRRCLFLRGSQASSAWILSICVCIVIKNMISIFYMTITDTYLPCLHVQNDNATLPTISKGPFETRRSPVLGQKCCTLGRYVLSSMRTSSTMYESNLGLQPPSFNL